MGLNDPCLSLQNAYWMACDRLLFRHTNPWELDKALTDWGCLKGPCAVMDHLGLNRVLKALNANTSPILPRMVAEGRIGKIGGVGFYRYPGGGGAVTDPLIEDLILEEAYFAKQPRSPLTDAALVEQINHTMSDEIRRAIAANGDRQQILDFAHSQLYLPATLLQSI